MHRFLATMLQTVQDYNPPAVTARISDNGSIWHHMSDALHQSVYRVLSLLIAVLPGILAVFVALTLFTLDRNGSLDPPAERARHFSNSTSD